MHPDVAKVRSLHHHILDGFDHSNSIFDLLDQFADNLYHANQSADERTYVEIKNFLKIDELTNSGERPNIDLNMAREIIARQHGFRDWQEVKYGGKVTLQSDFESTVDAIILGNLKKLTTLLNKKPHLIIQRSAYFHKGTLLHYISSNGVEIRRQLVPDNLP